MQGLAEHEIESVEHNMGMTRDPDVCTQQELGNKTLFTKNHIQLTATVDAITSSEEKRSCTSCTVNNHRKPRQIIFSPISRPKIG